MNMVEKANRDYVGYDYYSISVDKQKISMYIDYYESFGWTLDDEIYKENISKGDLHFKRERKIMNKVELTRLQRQLEDCLNQIGSLEKSVNERASIISITIGLIGTAFIAGSVFAVTAPHPMLGWMMILAIPGFICWVLPFYLFRWIKKKRAKKIRPFIEEKYDEIQEICTKAVHLLKI